MWLEDLEKANDHVPMSVVRWDHQQLGLAPSRACNYECTAAACAHFHENNAVPLFCRWCHPSIVNHQCYCELQILDSDSLPNRIIQEGWNEPWIILDIQCVKPSFLADAMGTISSCGSDGAWPTSRRGTWGSCLSKTHLWYSPKQDLDLDKQHEAGWMDGFLIMKETQQATFR